MNYQGWLILNINTIVLGLLLIIFEHGNKRTRGGTAFLRLIRITLLLVILDSAGDFAERVLGVHVLWLRQFSTYFVFAFDPLGYLFAMRYIDHYVETPDRKGRMRYLLPMEIYTVSNIAMVTASALLHLNWFYSYDSGAYARGPLFLPRALVNMLFCLVVQLYVLRYRKTINKTYRTSITLFPAIVLLGGLLQVALPGLALEYMATMLACLILFTYVQRVDVDTDFLTGTANRRGIDMALERMTETAGGQPFAAAMIDIDFFKTINDQYGHNAGDEALITLARGLMESFPKKAIIGRYGGDEFVVIVPGADAGAMKGYVTAFRAYLDRENSSGAYPYKLQVSIGYDVCREPGAEPSMAFQHHIDQLMYREKEANHARRYSVSH